MRFFVSQLESSAFAPSPPPHLHWRREYLINVNLEFFPCYYYYNSLEVAIEVPQVSVQPHRRATAFQ